MRAHTPFALVAALAWTGAVAQTMDAPMRHTPGVQSDWEREQEARGHQESDVRLPPYYREQDLIEIRMPPAASLRFYVDAASVTVTRDLVVRYTLVARSAQGAENVSYEGLRCAGPQHRVYALGQRGGVWKAVDAPWKPAGQVWARVLAREYFCPLRRTILSSAEGLDALRRGGHPERDDRAVGGVR